MKQDDIFISSEGDNWFSRNKDALGKKLDNDIILKHIQNSFTISKEDSVLEIGCSNGFRLHSISHSYGCKCYGIDASLKAIELGSKQFSDIQLFHGGAEELKFENKSFNIIIINFVLHWIDRTNLLKVISEIDRVLKDNGRIIIGDFYPCAPQKVKYHHLPNQQVFTYKQHYFEIFQASQMYSLEYLKSFDHTNPESGNPATFKDRCFLSVLKKEGDRLYAD